MDYGTTRTTIPSKHSGLSGEGIGLGWGGVGWGQTLPTILLTTHHLQFRKRRSKVIFPSCNKKGTTKHTGTHLLIQKKKQEIETEIAISG